MNFLGSGRCVLIVYTAVVMLAGCGGSQAPMNSTNASPPGTQGRMKMTSSSGCGSVCCPALPGGTGILSDGDFAQATDLGSRWNHVFKGTEFSPHWKVSKRNINFYGSTAWNVDGLCSVDLDGTPGPGGITHSQFQTEKREGYTVAFLFSGNGACESTMKSMLVKAAGQFATFTWNTSGGNDAQNGDWSEETFQFIATHRTTRLVFNSQDRPPSNCGPVVAGIVVTPS